MCLAIGFTLLPISKQAMTTSVVISEDVTPRCFLHMQTQEIMVRNHSCSPVHRRNKLFSTCSEKSARTDKWKCGSQCLASSAGELCDCGSVSSLPPSLPACVLGSSSEILLLWKVLFTGGDVTSQRVRSNFTGGSESGWSPRTELCLSGGSDVGGSPCC